MRIESLEVSAAHPVWRLSTQQGRIWITRDFSSSCENLSTVSTVNTIMQASGNLSFLLWIVQKCGQLNMRSTLTSGSNDNSNGWLWQKTFDPSSRIIWSVRTIKMSTTRTSVKRRVGRGSYCKNCIIVNKMLTINWGTLNLHHLFDAVWSRWPTLTDAPPVSHRLFWWQSWQDWDSESLLRTSLSLRTKT